MGLQQAKQGEAMPARFFAARKLLSRLVLQYYTDDMRSESSTYRSAVPAAVTSRLSSPVLQSHFAQVLRPRVLGSFQAALLREPTHACIGTALKCERMLAGPAISRRIYGTELKVLLGRRVRLDGHTLVEARSRR